MTDDPLSRRDFIRAGVAGSSALLLTGAGASGRRAEMDARPLGRTGHQVKLFSLGGQATLEREGTRDQAVEIINRAIDLGVNYIDTAAAYGRGRSQEYIGEVMATRRREVFLATKTHARDRDGALEHLEQSLRSLQTDRLDLWQLHNIRSRGQLDEIFAKGGALEALNQAREEGTVRFLGITGHYDPAPLMWALEEFDFDTILMALNAADPHQDSFTAELLPLANRKGMGIIGMKIPARGRIFRAGGITNMKQAMSYTLSLPVSTVIIGCDDVRQVEENVAVATDFQPLSEQEMRRLERLAAPYARSAQFFKKGGEGWRR